MTTRRREPYEKGLFYFIEEYVLKNKGKAEDYALKLQAHKKWPRMLKADRIEYENKAKEQEDQNTEQQKEQEKEQVEQQQEPEAPIKKKYQRGKRKASPKPKKGKQQKAQSVDNEVQVVQEKRGRAKKQNGEAQTRARTTSEKQKEIKEQQEKEEKEEQDDKEEEERNQLKQRISSIAKSKISYKKRNPEDKCDILHLKKKYDIKSYIEHYKNQVKEKKMNQKKQK
ncbi:hypothetical protein pb186bvf_002224 [Paramecium bursaria]